MNLFRGLTTVLFLLLSAAAGPAQEWFGLFGLKESPAEVIAGSTSRAWRLVRSEKYVASIHPCALPDIYRFYADGHMTIEQCINQSPFVTSHKWSVKTDGLYDVSITIDDVGYKLLLKSDKDGKRMILRQSSKSIIYPTSDQEFLLSDSQ